MFLLFPETFTLGAGVHDRKYQVVPCYALWPDGFGHPESDRDPPVFEGDSYDDWVWTTTARHPE